MNILVAGATGALGAQLVPRLVAAGHDVTGMTRGSQDDVRRLGARPVVADALDADAVGRAVGEVRPDVIVHQLTALSGSLDLRHFERTFAQTNRLRIEGTDNLLAAARAAGVQRFVAQSYAGWPYARSGGPVKTEEDPLDPAPVGAMRSTLDAIRHLEDAVTGAEGIVLRYGGFYGPGTSFTAGGESVDQIRGRKFPVVGDGAGVWSFIHIEDAAAATVAAVERGRPGDLQHRRRRAGARRRVAARGGTSRRREAAAPGPALARAAGRRRGRGGHDDRGARSLEREGQA